MGDADFLLVEAGTRRAIRDPFAHVRINGVPHAPLVTWFDLFALELKQRTQARLGYCSHSRWMGTAQVCRGCGTTRQLLLARGQL